MIDHETELWISKQRDKKLARYLIEQFQQRIERGEPISQADYLKFIADYSATKK